MSAPIKIDTSMSPMSYAPDIDIISPSTASSTSPSSSYSPVSPVDIIQHSIEQMEVKADKPYSLSTSMKKNGYIPIKKLGDTLQGSVWKVKSNKPNGDKTFVIKVTTKSLHEAKNAVVNGKNISVKEDILKETAILRYLTSNNPPEELAKFEGFFTDSRNYMLVMEDGGDGFFEFVTKCHQFISKGKLAITEWHRFCRIAFVQMVELVQWLHRQMHCCHLDLSLENFVIDNCRVMVNESSNQITFCDDFKIKLIDFGLSEVFVSPSAAADADKAKAVSFRCKKYVGKTAYKAPRVFAKQRAFDARAADVWSLGVILFMMIVGGSPYQKPDKTDATFAYIMNDEIELLLEQWGRSQFVTPVIVDLMARIFKKEKHRLNVDEIRKHPFLL